MRFHIIGVNKSSLETLNFLKKKKYQVTISDKQTKKQLKIKLYNKKVDKKFFFEKHPKSKIIASDYVIYSSGVICSKLDYELYKQKRKYLSEMEIFYKFNKWPSSNILLITGSRGKTTISKNLKKKLGKINIFKKIYYLDRKKILFSNVPKYKPGNFLIIEADYQTLILTKYIKAKFRIITSFFKNENKAFTSNDLYKEAKLKIIQNIKKKDIIILNKSTYLKLIKQLKKFKKKLTIVSSKKLIRDSNKIILDSTIDKIKENFSEKKN